MAVSIFPKILLCLVLSCSALSQTPQQAPETNGTTDHPKPSSVKDDRTPPELIYSVKPHFSKEEAKRIKWGKTITTVQLTVDTNGQVQE
ncbi:MAG TPA: hypothetical protein VGB69_05870, partial [Edaphobacter sp.]